MRLCALVVVLVAVPTLLAADEKEARPLSPDAASKRVGDKVTVQMEVKSTGMSAKRKMIFLNSEANYRDARNFTVVIGRTAADKLKAAKIDNPATHFKGKVIRVSGKVTLYMGHPEIAVETPDQIEVVEKKS
jgi:DNA/RNA endonuclease YhcR with UshA esterase domain